MKNHGIPIREINLTGGGSRSHLWNQILADMTGIPVYTLMNPNVAALGAAMLAGKGTGMFKSLDEACKLTVRIHSRFLPDAGNAIVYAHTYEKYIQLYSGLESYWKS
jgi:xylulokinase